MGLFNFSVFKSAISDVRTRISYLNKEIASIEERRKKLVGLPLPYEDFVDWAMGRYDALSEKYASQLKAHLLASDSAMSTFYMAERNGHETLEDFGTVFSRMCPVPFEKPIFRPGENTPFTEEAFFYIFKDTIHKGVRSILDETVKPKWPKEVGPARAERIVQLKKIEEKLDELIAERDRISAELSGLLQ